MNLYFDTSALIKKYIDETGSDIVDDLFNKAETIYVSNITEIETLSTFRRLLLEKLIDESDFDILKKELLYDFKYYEIIELDNQIVELSKEMVIKYQLKSLDSIQLGTIKSIANIIDYFVVCDNKLIKNSSLEKLKVINPME